MSRNQSEKTIDAVLTIVAVAMVLYHLATAFYYFVTPTEHLNIHLGFSLALVFLVSFKDAKRKLKLLYGFFLLLSLACILYVGIFNQELVIQQGNPFPSASVIAISFILVIVTIEANREAFGLTMPVVILGFLLYGLLGHYVPGYFHTSYVAPQDVFSKVGIGSLGTTGIYGLLLSVSADSIFLFMVFGGLLQASGATRFFNEVAKLVSGRLSGGAGLSSVVTSCLLGMATGSVTANVIITGSMTIPFMKRSGYKPEMAGAIEAVSSTGGQIMPPIMGAAAFLMAAMLGIPYIEVVIMAFIPALLYYLGIGIYVQLNGMKLKLTPTPEKVDFKELVLSSFLFVVPLIVLVVLLIQRYSLPYCVSVTIVILVALSSVRKETRPSLTKLLGGITQGAIAGAQIGAISASLGVVESITSWRGIGFKIPRAFLAVSGGNLTLGLIMIMLASILLGMGVPTSAAYLLVALTTAPALIKMGVTMAQAHLFSFYFACISMITPPVAIGAVVAAKLAEARFVKTGIEATKAAAGGFMVPYLMIWCPLIILQQQNLLMEVPKLISGLLFLISIEVCLVGYYLTVITLIERVIFGIISLLLFIYLPIGNNVIMGWGVVLFILATIWQWKKRKKEAVILDGR